MHTPHYYPHRNIYILSFPQFPLNFLLYCRNWYNNSKHQGTLWGQPWHVIALHQSWSHSAQAVNRWGQKSNMPGLLTVIAPFLPLMCDARKFSESLLHVVLSHWLPMVISEENWKIPWCRPAPMLCYLHCSQVVRDPKRTKRGFRRVSTLPWYTAKLSFQSQPCCSQVSHQSFQCPRTTVQVDRTFISLTVEKPSLWRAHYSVMVSDLNCDWSITMALEILHEHSSLTPPPLCFSGFWLPSSSFFLFS